MIAPYQSLTLRDVPFRLYGSLRAVNLLLVPALQIDGARSAWRLARYGFTREQLTVVGRTGNSPKPVQQKIENFVQAKLKGENRGYFGQHSTSADCGIPASGVLFSLRDSEEMRDVQQPEARQQ